MLLAEQQSRIIHVFLCVFVWVYRRQTQGDLMFSFFKESQKLLNIAFIYLGGNYITCQNMRQKYTAEIDK